MPCRNIIGSITAELNFFAAPPGFALVPLHNSGISLLILSALGLVPPNFRSAQEGEAPGPPDHQETGSPGNGCPLRYTRGESSLTTSTINPQSPTSLISPITTQPKFI